MADSEERDRESDRVLDHRYLGGDVGSTPSTFSILSRAGGRLNRREDVILEAGWIRRLFGRLRGRRRL